MHPLAVIAVVSSVQRRVAQGDNPAEPAQPRETLEELVIELWNRIQRRKILSDPDDEPSAGNVPESAEASHTPVPEPAPDLGMVWPRCQRCGFLAPRERLADVE